MKQINLDDKVFVAGGSGLVGSHLVEKLRSKGYKNVLAPPRSQLDLLDKAAVDAFYKTHQPQIVFVAAAKVGGILANNTFRSEFLLDNLTIQSNLIWGAHEHNVRRLIFLGSSCVYPKNSPQPMPESCLLTGSLEYTNRPYALAKIIGLELVNILRMQHKRDYFSIMPTNLYGPRDNFDLEQSHVLPALISKFVEAKRSNASQVQIWGSGAPKREFLHAEDCADGIIFAAENITAESFAKMNSPENFFHLNLGSNAEVTILELANTIKDLVGFEGKLVFDATKPDGVIRKLIDSSALRNLGWKPKLSLREGIASTIKWYLENKIN